MAQRYIAVQEDDFDLTTQYQKVRALGGSDAGAVASFIGLVRDQNKHAGDGGQVRSLTLEHYPGMTESSIDAIIAEAESRWPLLVTQVIHRVGTLQPQDQKIVK